MLLVPDPETRLAISYARPAARAGLAALFALDARLGEITRGKREVMATQFRLAWWRDALNALGAAPPPGEPLLQALAATVVRAGVSGAALAALVDGWEAVLGDEAVDPAVIASRGAGLFGLAAQLLAEEADRQVSIAGEIWALIDHARHAGSPGAAERSIESARLIMAAGIATRWPKQLRMLGALAVLAMRDARHGADHLERQGEPVRVARMLLLRLTGR
ncbi:squalene/phytoene synthase family protein [Sphingomonas sp. GlSt437]|uniref:squalene/phytoene synthase family protein n=1 Tax=Sphingomonas sp. GlSt437 TaxID=3389970 RepID=UPI003A85F77E